ncbi:hypothetical protein [Chryseobacterium indologenes]|uniref:hypothetical protein n=1 Tax=Chryseobacterium indologenes TaxID=253 RepID=UPI00078691DB|nr:hypothetical protein [Chryseobacterium indologenes]
MENIELEKEEIELLVGNSYSFETNFFGKKKTWNIGKLSMGKMLRLSKISIKIKVDEEALSNADLSIQLPAQYEAVRDNAGLLAEAVSVAVESKLPKWFLKWHFLNSLNSKDIMDFSLELLKFSNYQNFMTSTVLMNGNRPTKAMPIEKQVSKPSTEQWGKSATTSDGL